MPAAVTTESLPPAAAFPDTPVVPLPTPTPVDPRAEAISSTPTGGWASATTGAYARSLPWYSDDLTADFGWWLYGQMGHDPQIHSGTHIIVKAVLAHPLQLVPPDPAGAPVDPERLLRFCDRTLDALEPSLPVLLNEMLPAAMQDGHKLAEKIYVDGQIDPAARGGQLILRHVKTKPLTAYAWVVDPFNNVLGVLPQRPGRPFVNPGIMLANLPPEVAFLDRSRVASLCWAPQNNDPRGTSAYRVVYGPWWGKQQAFPDLLKGLARFGQPIVRVIAPANLPTVDSKGQPLANPLQPLHTTALGLAAGGVGTFPFGTLADLLEARGDGAAILHAIEHYNAEIIKGLTYQSLGTDQGAHASRAQATVHQDMIGLLVRFTKAWAADFVRTELLQPAVALNYGQAAVPWTPYADLGQTDPQDFGPVAQAFAQLNAQNPRGWFAPSQYRALDARLGFPVRSAAEATAMWDGLPPAAGAAPATPAPATSPAPEGSAP